MTQKQRSLAEGKSNLDMFLSLTQRAQKTQMRTCYRSCLPPGCVHSAQPTSCEPLRRSQFCESLRILRETKTAMQATLNTTH